VHHGGGGWGSAPPVPQFWQKLATEVPATGQQHKLCQAQ